MCTILDDTETNNTRLKELEAILSKRGYLKEIITIGINKAKALNQKELRTPQARQTTENILTFVTTFNPKLPIDNLTITEECSDTKKQSKDEICFGGNKNYKQQETTTKPKETTTKIKILPTKQKESCQNKVVKDALHASNW